MGTDRCAQFSAWRGEPWRYCQTDDSQPIAALRNSGKFQSPLQQRYREVASYLVADGTAAIQKRIIATSLLGRVAAQ